MKANAAQIGSAIDRLGRGDQGADRPRLLLFHGPDEAGANEYADRLARTLGAEAERIDLDGPTLKAQPGRLADEAAAISLFGGARWIRATGIGEESLEAIQLLLASPAAGNPVIAIAPGLKATGKLVKFALSAPGVLTLACYVPDGEGAAKLAAGIAREHGVRLMGGAAAALADACGGDRAVLTREIEKIALYLDAGTDRPREAGEDVLTVIGANLPDVEISAAVAAVIEGRPAMLGGELGAIEAAGLSIPMLRSLAKRLVALADMRGDVDRGESPDAVVEKHRVFWKERRSTVAALRRWSAPQIAAGVARVRRAERGLLTGGNPAAVVPAHHLLSLARAVERG